MQKDVKLIEGKLMVIPRGISAEFFDDDDDDGAKITGRRRA